MPPTDRLRPDNDVATPVAAEAIDSLAALLARAIARSEAANTNRPIKETAP